MVTARNIIKKAMQKGGILIKSEDPADDEANDALDTLNMIMDSISNDALNIYARTWENFTLGTGTLNYTIGPGGDFNTIRPMQIVDCYLQSGLITYDMTVIPDEAYDSITYKTLTGIPEFLNFDNAYPLANIKLYPVPSTGYQLFLLSEKAVQNFPTLDTVMVLPNGWARFLIYSLAIELAPDYNQPVDPVVVGLAKEAMGKIKIGVARVRTMDAYPRDIGIRNIYSGWRY